jgi:hypothetical protein
MPAIPFRSHRSSCPSTWLALATAFAILGVATTSAADPAPAETSTDPDGYTYRFGDDPLRAGGLDPKDARLHVVRHAARDLLIRPRVHFIREMLKSVENL